MHPNHTNYKVIISMASFTPLSILNSLVLLCLLCSLWSGFASKGEETGKCDPSYFLSFQGDDKVTYMSLVHKNAPNFSLFFQGVQGKNGSESDEKTEMLIPSRDKDWTTMDIDGTTGSNYLVKVCLGGQEIKLSFDTGSVLTWTQCNCKNDDSYCYYQVDESFDRFSKNFKKYPCSIDKCKISPGVKTRCSIEDDCISVEGLYQPCSQKEECKYHDQNKISERGECLYTIEYGDRSSTSGVLGHATLNLGNFNNKFLFGCGNQNNGLFSNKEDGILGLGYDEKFSIVSQTESTYHKKFAYCIPLDKHGFLRFGGESNSVQSNKEVMQIGWHGFSYVLKLRSMKVKSKQVQSNNIRVVVDSGTTFTRLTRKLFEKLKLAYEEEMKKEGHQKVEDRCLKPDDLKDFDECYKIVKEPFEAPVITFQFARTSVDLPSEGITVRSGSYACLAFLELNVKSDIVIWGSYQQKGIEINFDVGDRKMWFNKLDDCKPKILGGNNVPL